MLTQKLVNMGQAGNQGQIKPRHKAITALFPYAVWRERSGECGMVDALLDIVQAPEFGGSMWEEITPFIPTLFTEASPRSIVLVSPLLPWSDERHDETLVVRWAAAAAGVPYTMEVGQSVVGALLHIATNGSLHPHIPVDIWVWLNKRPSLPRICLGRSKGTEGCVVRQVRALGDIEILKSYLLLVWSQWNPVHPGGLTEMSTLIREDFGGIGMQHHRGDLIKHLNLIIAGLEQQSDSLKLDLGLHQVLLAIRQYKELEKELLEVDRRAKEIPTRTSPRLASLSDSLILAYAHRVPLDVHLCALSPVPGVAYQEHSLLDPPTRRFCFTPSLHQSSDLL